MDTKVKILSKTEWRNWDKLVKDSPQGTLFHSSIWLEMMEELLESEIRIYGCFSGENLVGGCPVLIRKKGPFKKTRIPPLTPFLGILTEPTKSFRISAIESLNKKIIDSIINTLQKDFIYVKLANHSSLTDIRPFIWAKWKPQVKYTFITDLTDINALWKTIDQGAKYEVNKARKNGIEISVGWNISHFYDLFNSTYFHQGLNLPFSKEFLLNSINYLLGKKVCKIYFAVDSNKRPIACAQVVWDSKRAYYLNAASDPSVKSSAPSLLLWSIFEDLSGTFSEIDLVGANIPTIAKFKKDFASKLSSYYIVEWFPPFLDFLYDFSLIPKGIRQKFSHER